jgi:hypothetical protein
VLRGVIWGSEEVNGDSREVKGVKRDSRGVRVFKRGQVVKRGQGGPSEGVIVTECGVHRTRSNEVHIY